MVVIQSNALLLKRITSPNFSILLSRLYFPAHLIYFLCAVELFFLRSKVFFPAQ